MKVYWKDIPDKTLLNFKLHCGYNLSNPAAFSTYLTVAEVELQQFHCYWMDNHYVFRSEADYHWFILRWS